MPRLVRIVGPAALLLVALAFAIFSLQFGGAVTPQKIADPGPVVRYGLPLAKMLVNLSAAGTIGALVLASFAMVKDKREYGNTLDVAAATSAIWAVSSAASGFFSFLTAYLQPLSFDDRFGKVLGDFISSTEVGQSWLATTLIAAVLTVLCFAVRNQGVVFAMAFVGILGLIPMALQGHSGSAEGHDAATSAIYLHIVAAAVWIGGLLTIALTVRSLESGRMVPIIERYSSLALVSFVVIVISGYVSAEIRVGTLDNLLTPYGILVLIKIAALGALGLFGIAQRRFLIGRMKKADAPARKYFWWLIVGELAFMGVASGTAAALARTATPRPEVVAAEGSSPAQLLTESPLPPPISAQNLLTLWNFDLLWVVL